MILKHDDVIELLRVVAETRGTEIGCEECFERLDTFAETQLLGVDASTAMPLVRDHLDKCADCRSTFDSLLEALRAT